MNFAAAPQAEEIVKSKALFPNNNKSQMEYKNADGKVLYIINLAYFYDGDYLTSATVSLV